MVYTDGRLKLVSWHNAKEDYGNRKWPLNEVFAFGQAIREASLTVLRPTVHGSKTSRTQNATEDKPKFGHHTIHLTFAIWGIFAWREKGSLPS